MGVIRSESEVTTLRGFALGVDNTNPETQLSPQALRVARNVDIDTSGRVSRRDGRRLLAAGDYHSLFAHPDYPFLLRRHGDALEALDAALTPAVVATGLGDVPVSYCELNGEIAWTAEGLRTGRLTGMLEDMPLGLPAPAGFAASVLASGGLDAGSYGVTVTYLDAFGEESAAAVVQRLTVPAGGGIRLALPPAPDWAAHVRAYLTEADGSALFAAQDELALLGTLDLGAGAYGSDCETLDLAPLPAGHLVRESNGVLWVAKDNVLYYGQPMRPRLHHPGQNFIPYPDRIDMLEPVGEAAAAGLYVASGARVYWLAGATPRAVDQRFARTVGVVPGTARGVPGEWFGETAPRVAFWMGRDGVPCLGLPGGSVRRLAKKTAMTRFDVGATLLRERDGLRQVLVAGPKGPLAATAASDSAEVYQFRNGIPVP